MLIILELLLGIILCVKNKNKPMLYLGLFIFSFSYNELLFEYLIELGVPFNSNVFFLPIHTSFFTIPFFLLYVNEVTITEIKNIRYFFLPGAIDLIINLMISLLLEETRGEIFNNAIYYKLRVFIPIIFDLSIFMYIYKVIKKHYAIRKKYVVINDKDDAKWVQKKMNMFIALAILLFVLTVIFIKEAKMFLVISMSIEFVIIFQIFLKGILYTDFKPLELGDRIEIKETTIPESLLVLDDTIESELLYLNKDLTIVELSSKLNLHAKVVSNYINLTYKVNYNTYINKFRVNKAIELIIDNRNDHLTIDTIGEESGFKSKSVFYTAFKKETGLTPKQYKQNRK